MRKRQSKIKSCESQIQSTVEIPINYSSCFIKLFLRVVVGFGRQGAGRGGLSTHSERERFVFEMFVGSCQPQGIEHRALTLGLYLEILTLNVLESRVLIGFLFLRQHCSTEMCSICDKSSRAPRTWIGLMSASSGSSPLLQYRTSWDRWRVHPERVSIRMAALWWI